MTLYYILMLCVGSFFSEIHLGNFVPFGDYKYELIWWVKHRIEYYFLCCLCDIFEVLIFDALAEVKELEFEFLRSAWQFTAEVLWIVWSELYNSPTVLSVSKEIDFAGVNCEFCEVNGYGFFANLQDDLRSRSGHCILPVNHLEGSVAIISGTIGVYQANTSLGRLGGIFFWSCDL